MQAARYAKLGQKWTCYSCDRKFYDLQKAEAICPNCKADQAARPPEPLTAPKKPARKSTRARKSTGARKSAGAKKSTGAKASTTAKASATAKSS